MISQGATVTTVGFATKGTGSFFLTPGQAKEFLFQEVHLARLDIDHGEKDGGRAKGIQKAKDHSMAIHSGFRTYLFGRDFHVPTLQYEQLCRWLPYGSRRDHRIHCS